MGGEKLPDGSLVLAGAAGTALVSRDQGLSFVPITTSTTRAFAKPILGAQDKLLLLGEAGVREGTPPLARGPVGWCPHPWTRPVWGWSCALARAGSRGSPSATAALSASSPARAV